MGPRTRDPGPGLERLPRPGQGLGHADYAQCQWRHVAEAVAVEEYLVVTGWEGECAAGLIGSAGDGEQPGHGLVFEPLAGVALGDARPGGDSAGVAGPPWARARYKPRRSPTQMCSRSRAAMVAPKSRSTSWSLADVALLVDVSVMTEPPSAASTPRSVAEGSDALTATPARLSTPEGVLAGAPARKGPDPSAATGSPSRQRVDLARSCRMGPLVGRNRVDRSAVGRLLWRPSRLLMQVEAREGVIDLPGSQGVTSSTPSASIHSQQWFLSTHDRRLAPL